MLLSSGDSYVGELRGVKDPFEAQEGRWDFSRDDDRKRASSRVQGRISWFSRVPAGNLGFLSSYDRDLKGPFILPQETPVSMRVARGVSGSLSSQCRVLGPHLELRPQPQVSSPVLTWISEFLRNFHREVRPCLERRHASPLSSQPVTVVSGFLSS